MKFLIIGDLHGQMPKIYYKDFDAIIAPGDFCSDKTKKYRFKLAEEKLKNPNFKKRWYEIVGKKKALRMIKKSLSDGRRILEYLNSFDVPVYIVPGNWDWSIDKRFTWEARDYFKELIKNIPNVIEVHYKIYPTNGYQIIGYGTSLGPEYPQHREDMASLTVKELKEKKIDYLRDSKKLSSLFEIASKPVIFLSHNVPFNTSLDRITNKESPRYGWHYGSIIARKIIEKYQPLVCIGGHMHENFGKCKIGKTACINAGFGSNVNVLMELDKNKIVRLQFHKK